MTWLHTLLSGSISACLPESLGLEVYIIPGKLQGWSLTPMILAVTLLLNETTLQYENASFRFRHCNADQRKKTLNIFQHNINIGECIWKSQSSQCAWTITNFLKDYFIMHSVFWNANICRCSVITLPFSFQLLFKKSDHFSLWKKNLYALD